MPGNLGELEAGRSDQTNPSLHERGRYAYTSASDAMRLYFGLLTPVPQDNTGQRQEPG